MLGKERSSRDSNKGRKLPRAFGTFCAFFRHLKNIVAVLSGGGRA